MDGLVAAIMIVVVFLSLHWLLYGVYAVYFLGRLWLAKVWPKVMPKDSYGRPWVD
jgi:hypothetical protein